ncbi:hypothetical protein GGF31_004880, partial [Allomyces arbusculus]
IAWIPAIKAASVKLFAPSDLGILFTPTERKAVPSLLEAKHQVEETLTAAEVPSTTVFTGGSVEHCLVSPFMGIDIKNNTLQLYIGAGYASIFATTPADQSAGRMIALAEVSLQDVDADIATSDVALGPLLRKKWGPGAFTVGSDIWEVP